MMSIDGVGHVAAPRMAVNTELTAQQAAPILDTDTPRSFRNMEEVHADIRRVVDSLVQVGHSLNRRLDFQVSEDTNQVVVRIVDSDSGEVIKQVPTDALLRLHARIQEAVGLLFDETT